MYLTHYHLKHHPFKITCDPKFLWFSEKHKEALANLRYGLTTNRGFILLTGEVGTGKTLLINQLLTMLPENTIAANLSGPNVDSMDFYRLLADQLKIPHTYTNLSEFLIEIRNCLLKANADGQRIVLIIDEAQVFGHQVMEDIRMLSNIEFPDEKLISIFLVGQPELNQTISDKKNRALAQRITARCNLEPLDLTETTNYICHRLKVAGGSGTLFTRKALKKIFECTGGIPRLINVICDHALLTGSVDKLKRLDAPTIAECAQELHISEYAGLSATFASQNPGVGAGIPSQSSGAIEKPERKDTKPSALNRRFTKWAYACVIPAVALVIMLVPMNFDVKATLSTVKMRAPGFGSKPSPAVTKADKMPSPDLQWSKKKQIPILFNRNNQITARAMVAIDLVARQLRQFPEQTVKVYGYTDDADHLDKQKTLWQQRIDAVKTQLISKGIYAYQISIVDITQPSPNLPNRIPSRHYACIEYRQDNLPDTYNADK